VTNPSGKRFPRRGSVFLVNLNPTLGSEIRKTRPAVILQNDIGNQYSSTTIVAPITSGEEAIFPVEVAVQPPEGGLANPSLILLSQIRTIDKRRLVKKLGELSADTMARVDRAALISLGLADEVRKQ